MNCRAPAILDHLASLADTTRSRILLLLDRHELTVSELCAVMQLPQSTVSRHLKALADAGWIGVARRRHEPPLHDGPRRPRRLGAAAVAARARAGRALAGGRAGPAPAAGGAGASGAPSRRSSSRRRPANGIAAATSCSATDFTSRALAALARAATGSSAISAAAPARSAPRSRRSSRASSPSTRRRRCWRPPGSGCRALDNVELRRGELEALPIDDGRLDAATLMLVLHHVPEPERALAEVARVLKPGGRAAPRRHAAARSRELPPADGPRVARVRGRAGAPHPQRDRVRRR